MASPETWGLGIDEGNAVALENDNRMEVLGTGYVMLFVTLPADRKTFAVRLLQPGSYDLGKLIRGKP